ncbi:hypothetical protein [Flavihumibacter sp. UBA7668]|uniref:hypothetical protein n=1 Tax=Flavihumibacter sp. UBA7668 TaxID=1946542 RepID=UPI0025BB8430|nr:hypothetical protein [Flavihumibacter sp. UBA7668]
MNPSHKIVTELPLSSIWNSTEELDATRISYLTKEEIIEILREKPVKLVIASIGEKPEWIDSADQFKIWNKTLSPRLVSNQHTFSLDDFPGNYGFLASLWEYQKYSAIILFEKYH